MGIAHWAWGTVQRRGILIFPLLPAPLPPLPLITLPQWQQRHQRLKTGIRQSG